MEGLINLLIESENTDEEHQLRRKLNEGSLLWRIKLSLLKQGYNIGGPINSVSKFSTFAANNLWLYNKWGIAILMAAKYVFALDIPLVVSNLIGAYITGVKPLWEV